MWLDFFFPNRCVGCQVIIGGDEVVCESCMNQIAFTHAGFYEDNQLLERCRTLFPVVQACALMDFEKKGLSRALIHELKYKGREKIGKILASWTVSHVKLNAELPDVLVPVPLHSRKERQRGYNQLHLYTKLLSEHYGIPFDFEILKRPRYAKAQALRNKKERSSAKIGFALTKPIEHRHVLLIDDVFTTGNTLSMAAWEILKGKNNRVSVLVMAQDF